MQVAHYCLSQLWRYFHLKSNALLEAEIEESLKDSDEEMDTDDESYVPSASCADSESDGSVEDDFEDDNSAVDDSEETMGELNLDLAFNCERMPEESTIESDFASLLLLLTSHPREISYGVYRPWIHCRVVFIFYIKAVAPLFQQYY
jgi:hypothetical protein